MSGRYRPSSQASQRDVGLQIPVDFVTAPGVAVTAACFGNEVYDQSAAVKCLSNLLATGFRRLIFDVYWDQRRLTWSLCPAEISGVFVQSQPTASSAFPSTTEESLEGGRLSSSQDPPSTASEYTTSIDGPTASADALVARQDRSESINTSLTIGNSISGTGTSLTRGEPSPTQAANTLASPASTTANGGLFSVGPYKCSKDLGIFDIAEVLDDFLRFTDDTLNAVLRYMVFNLHAASPLNDAASPASRPPNSRLPSTPNLIGNLFHTRLSSYMYTPGLLQSQRADIQGSWLSVGNSSQPDPGYFTTLDDASNTPDGWPSESFLEFENMRRVLVGIDNVDPQIANYDFDNDDYIFQGMTLSNLVDVNLSPNGTVVDDCIVQTDEQPTVKAANSSWAVSTNVAGLDQLETGVEEPNLAKLSISNLTACGYTPILNSSVGQTADVDIEPYQTFVYTSVWSWAWEEPSNDSFKPSYRASGEDASDTDFRCALFDSSNLGRWRTAICQNRHYAACRTNGAPYSWRISQDTGSYGEVGSSCPDGTRFAVPRNALENRYLLSAANDPELRRDNVRELWLNFNSLSVESCWVAGVNTTCPYTPLEGYNTREIVAPTVGAIIVIVIALLTLLVKCGANRRRTRRKRQRKRVHKGWEYEGVPQ
ncbi:MAG: hypothetical protein M1831_005098 [Alyxoria varia]|nr:MAG: hypothetical protein M1831_005098 [Alyxoria varia]